MESAKYNISELSKRGAEVLSQAMSTLPPELNPPPSKRAHRQGYEDPVFVTLQAWEAHIEAGQPGNTAKRPKMRVAGGHPNLQYGTQKSPVLAKEEADMVRAAIAAECRASEQRNEAAEDEAASEEEPATEEEDNSSGDDNNADEAFGSPSSSSADSAEVLPRTRKRKALDGPTREPSRRVSAKTDITMQPKAGPALSRASSERQLAMRPKTPTRDDLYHTSSANQPAMPPNSTPNSKPYIGGAATPFSNTKLLVDSKGQAFVRATFPDLKSDPKTNDVDIKIKTEDEDTPLSTFNAAPVRTRKRGEQVVKYTSLPHPLATGFPPDAIPPWTPPKPWTRRPSHPDYKKPTKNHPYVHAICGRRFTSLEMLKAHHFPSDGPFSAGTGCWERCGRPNIAWNAHKSCKLTLRNMRETYGDSSDEAQ
ncbi:hypothetical protein K402DRAFT_418266 [Aulographum hederae CBS 113979]|uniref:Uncharacterized protein n=1 Tax=Aulographum hederae CBS 113979 TaxID=1176131 RepID=A0A6G1H941_9PEZI|nr:hypothetical protein K402DRAFT_418266 [Aulographum hederae CBS 113979]